MRQDPPEQFRVARRALEALPFCDILEDLTAWDEWWFLRIAITNHNHTKISPKTEWYALLPRNYPFGEISFFPSKSNGLIETYPHQAYNGVTPDDVPWLSGKPCVSSSLRNLGRRTYDIEPMSVGKRLAWHVRRLRDWLEAADRGLLLMTGDPFELPEYPNTLSGKSLGFIGSTGRVDELKETTWDTFGSVIIHSIAGDGGTHVWFPSVFKDIRGTTISKYERGDLYPCEEDDLFAVWVRVKDIPHIDPWRGLRTYGELLEFLQHEGVSFDRLLMQFDRGLRDGKRHLLLIGFPVPEKVGCEYGSWYWLSILLPVLSHGRVNGFRMSSNSYLLRDKATVITEHSDICWIKSRSWSPKDILSRGSFDTSITEKKVLIIGLGAVGTLVAELLVRAGVKNLVLIDDDRLEIGNLSRHTLTIKEVGEHKVSAVKRRLQIAEPQVVVEALAMSFYDVICKSRHAILSSDVIVDCTGDDSLLYDLSTIEFDSKKMFISLSVGFGAKQAFVFCARDIKFPVEKLMHDINPYLDNERANMEGRTLPRDGLGCWHPAFPARCDDIWMMTSAGVKIVEAFLLGKKETCGLTILRRQETDDVFSGIERIFVP